MNTNYLQIEELNQAKKKMLVIDKIFGSIIPILILAAAAYSVQPNNNIFLICAIVILLSLANISKKAMKNYDLSLFTHFISIYLAVILSAYLFPFVKYEYIMFIPFSLTLFGCYSFHNMQLNKFIMAMFFITSIPLCYFDFMESRAFPQYENFNRIFILVFSYICIIEIYITNRIQRLTANITLKSQQLYSNLFDHSLDAIFVYDLEKDQIVQHNKAFKETFRIGEEIDITTIKNSALHPERHKDGRASNEIIKASIQWVKKHRSSKKLFHQNKRLDGEIFESETTLIPNIYEENNLLVMIKDISQKQKQETVIKDQLIQLNQKNTELQIYIDKNLQLENFVHIASHDLKTPLRSTISFVQLLSRSMKEKTKQQEEFIDFIESSTKDMYNFLEDLLVFSVLGKEDVKYSIIPIHQMIKSIQRQMASIIKKNNASIHINFDQSILITADKIKLQHIIRNLIGNSIKYRQEEVDPIINIELKELVNKWEFSFHDNGIGIPEAFLDRIFLIFERLKDKSNVEGTGIGLALCKRLVEAHNGQISASSTVGQGSTFVFSILKNQSRLSKQALQEQVANNLQ